jgi:hypothetical protein
VRTSSGGQAYIVDHSLASRTLPQSHDLAVHHD